uniref:DCD domain-containing protein n=1 Tax=Ananas comosus var. bracteatus TaxID=296719 RepID=A0A6V7Q170_ANACO|nr:unnamed protein product [Ananas comosus var. bracteatus]
MACGAHRDRPKLRKGQGRGFGGRSGSSGAPRTPGAGPSNKSKKRFKAKKNKPMAVPPFAEASVAAVPPSAAASVAAEDGGAQAKDLASASASVSASASKSAAAVVNSKGEERKGSASKPAVDGNKVNKKGDVNKVKEPVEKSSGSSLCAVQGRSRSATATGATSKGGLNLAPEAFNGAFPSQVKFRIDKDCLPLPESTFKHAIEDNYQSKGKFTPQLNSKQVRKLLDLFRPINLVSPPAPVQYIERLPPPPVVHLPPPEDPYRCGQVLQAPLKSSPNMSDPYAHQPLPLPADPYAHQPPPLVADPYAHQPPPVVVDPYAHHRFAPAAPEPPPVHVAVLPPNDPYYPAPVSDPYQVEAVRAYYPENPVQAERIAYRLVPEVIPRDQLQGRDYRQLTAREGEVAPPPLPPPRSDHVHEMYYPERAVVRHAATHSTAAELAPQPALPLPLSRPITRQSMRIRTAHMLLRTCGGRSQAGLICRTCPSPPSTRSPDLPPHTADVPEDSRSYWCFPQFGAAKVDVVGSALAESTDTPTASHAAAAAAAAAV